MASKSEAKQLAGELLRLVPVGQSMQAQHDAKMGEAYDEVWGRLESLGVPVWDKDDEMPDEVTPYFVYLMAHNKMDLYGISDSLYVRIANRVGPEGQNALIEIKALMEEPYYTNAMTDY